MNNTKEKMKNEAIRRLQVLVDKLGLDASVVDKFRAGQLCLSCPSWDGDHSDLFDFEKDWDYQEDVDAFEQETGYLVYHVVEDLLGLNFFYVDEEDEDTDWSDWDINNGWTNVYGTSFNPQLYSNEYGYMKFAALDGALIRIG